MSRTISFSVAAILGMFLMMGPRDASALGYFIFVDCETGLGVAPTGPNPNILCEFYWEGLGPTMVFHGDWSGVLIETINPLNRDEFISPLFDLRTTPQPQTQYFACSDVPGPINVNVIAKSYRTEPKPIHYEFFSLKNDSVTALVGINAPCHH